ncbi:hypothetical protein ACFX5K_01780 [Rickettsiales bacterium LUAb2]
MNYAFLIDIRPFSNGFAITTGLVHNNMRSNLNFDAKYGFSLGYYGYNMDVGDVIGSVTAHVKTKNNLTPYFGFSYSKVTTNNRGFTPYMDVGVYLFQANLDYKVNCYDNDTGVCESSVESITNTLDKLKKGIFSGKTLFYPVIKLGLAYKF